MLEIRVEGLRVQGFMGSGRLRWYPWVWGPFLKILQGNIRAMFGENYRGTFPGSTFGVRAVVP